MIDDYLQPRVSNGNPREQALIRSWWSESCRKEGDLVWEYYIDGFYIDALLFQDTGQPGSEHPGRETSKHFPVFGRRIVMCEAKIILNPEVIGQALSYATLLKRAGAVVEKAVVFVERSNAALEFAARELGFEVNQPCA